MNDKLGQTPFSSAFWSLIHQKTILVRIICLGFLHKKIGSKQIFDPNNFQSENIIWFKKIVVPNNFLVRKSFMSTKYFRCGKMGSLKIILGPKMFWFQKIWERKVLSLKYFWFRTKFCIEKILGLKRMNVQNNFGSAEKLEYKIFAKLSPSQPAKAKLG